MPHRCVAIAVLAALCACLAPDPAAAQASRDRAAREAENYELALLCRGAVWKKTFDDATAAGLNPGAIVVPFDTSKTTKTRDGGTLLVAGIDDYRPSHEVPAFPVRFECTVDIASKQVREVVYEAVDEDGNPIAMPPTGIVRHARYVEACRSEIDSRIHSDAVDRGLSSGGSESKPDVASATVSTRGTTTEIAGSGRFRLTRDYDWQGMTFTCRYDEKKKRVSRVSYRVDEGMSLGALSLERSRALAACRIAVREAVADDAERRGYRWARRVVVKLEKVGDIVEKGQALEVAGSGWFKSDDRHDQSTPITYACWYEPERDRVVKATFEQVEGARTPSGEIASGKTGTLVCESRYNENRVCPAQIRGNVRVIREMGRTKCEAYKNWIYSLSGITVWGGCRAEFEFDAR